MTSTPIDQLDEKLITSLADAIYSKLIGAGFYVSENDLRLKLALEHRLTGSKTVPFGLDRLGTADTASYLGLMPETLRSTSKRKQLGLPQPYNFAKKLFWRRSELDDWIEKQRLRDPT
jgi:hypothetical protein